MRREEANLFHLFGFISLVVGCVLSVVALFMFFFEQETIVEFIESIAASVDGGGNGP